MRGQNKVAFGTSDDGSIRYDGGDYTFDPAFQSGPAEFRKHALEIWNRNVMPVVEYDEE